MSNTGKKRFELTNFDDLIGGNSNTEQIIKVPLKDLHTFKDHPFHVNDDEKMEETTESIRKYGVLVPGIARPRAEGGYEVISGHRRRRGCELAGLEEMPVIVRNYSDDEATIIMVDANIQRENLLPSEKAFAYRMKYDAMKHQGVKGEINTADQVGEKAGDSGRTVQRYIRLSYLIPELLDKVDSGELAMIPGERLSFLSQENQKMVQKTLEDSNVKLSKEKADEIKKAEAENLLTEETINQILSGKGLQEIQTPDLLSFYGLPKTVRPDDSLIKTPGCGGKYDCFSCSRECSIRQESRLCQVATLGNPFPCSLVDNEKWKKNIKFSLYQEECQILHPELAPIRAGDQEPAPCCLNCPNKTCYNRCETAKSRDAEEIKSRQKEERERIREEDAKKPEPTPEEIRTLYDRWNMEIKDNVSADELKDKYKNAGGGYGIVSWSGSYRGVRINGKRELTWAQVAKAFKEIRAAGKTGKELSEDLLYDFYRVLYPSIRAIIKNRNAAEITRTLKEEYGASYENGTGYSCYPDKIVFRDSGSQIQIVWGKFTMKLLAYLDAHPEIETLSNLKMIEAVQDDFI